MPACVVKGAEVASVITNNHQVLTRNRPTVERAGDKLSDAPGVNPRFGPQEALLKLKPRGVVIGSRGQGGG